MATLKNTVINDTGHVTLPVGTTAERPASPTVGMMRYNTSLGFSEQYTADGWQGIAPPPVITSISPTSFNGESGTTITVNGSNFDTTASVSFILTGGVVVNATTTTRVSTSQLTATTPRDFLASESPASVKATNGSGLAATLEAGLTFSDLPVFTTASGSIGSIYDGSRTNFAHLSALTATDANSGSIASYSIVSGALPTGLSLNSTTAALTGTASAVGSDTTSTFTVRATDNAGNTTDRSFSITVRAPVVTSFTSVGTTSFSVPVGVVSAQVLVVAGGGGGGTKDNPVGTDGGAGGGAGGMIDHPAFPLTPGGSVSLTVGAGGAGGATPNNGNKGSDSVFGTLTAIGGGFGGKGPLSPNPGGPGGSGGGEGGGGGTAGGDGARGVGVQPTQPGASGTYGYGNPGGRAQTNTSPYTGSGGGGASGVGSNGNSAGVAPGGSGRASSVTGSSVTYAGGGGGGGFSNGSVPGGTGGSGGGGNGGTGGAGGDNGADNRGGGAGGGCGNGAAGSGPGNGGTGGPGIVVVKY